MLDVVVVAWLSESSALDSPLHDISTPFATPSCTALEAQTEFKLIVNTICVLLRHRIWMLLMSSLCTLSVVKASYSDVTQMELHCPNDVICNCNISDAVVSVVVSVLVAVLVTVVVSVLDAVLVAVVVAVEVSVEDTVDVFVVVNVVVGDVVCVVVSVVVDVRVELVLETEMVLVLVDVDDTVVLDVTVSVDDVDVTHKIS